MNTNHFANQTFLVDQSKPVVKPAKLMPSQVKFMKETPVEYSLLVVLASCGLLRTKLEASDPTLHNWSLWDIINAKVSLYDKQGELVAGEEKLRDKLVGFRYYAKGNGQFKLDIGDVRIRVCKDVVVISSRIDGVVIGKWVTTYDRKTGRKIRFESESEIKTWDLMPVPFPTFGNFESVETTYDIHGNKISSEGFSIYGNVGSNSTYQGFNLSGGDGSTKLVLRDHEANIQEERINSAGTMACYVYQDGRLIRSSQYTTMSFYEYAEDGKLLEIKDINANPKLDRTTTFEYVTKNGKTVEMRMKPSDTFTSVWKL